MFSNNELAAQIKEQLNTESVIPDGKTGALVVHVDRDGVRSTIATKVGKTWEVSGNFNWHESNHGWDFGTNIIRTW